MNTKLIGGIIAVIVVIGVGAFIVAPLLNPSDNVKLAGAGSSFINPLMQEWTSKYDASGVTINYQSVGSGTGIKLVTNKTVDFGASDAPLKASEYATMGNAIHIPGTVGAIVVAYNIPNVGDGLKMNSTIIASIFMGETTTWDDASITQLNPGVTLPSETINVVHRSDGSGTTFGFTDYLTRAAPSIWTLGTAKSVDWKTGIGGKGNEGVSSGIKNTDYSIGYIELAYAHSNNFNTVAIENLNGDFVQASTEGIQKALDNKALTLPKGEESWENVSLVNAGGSGSYSIVSFTYIIVYQDLNNLKDKVAAQELVNFIWWAVHDGQQYSGPLDYVSLSSGVVSINERSLGLLTYNGEALTLPSS